MYYIQNLEYEYDDNNNIQVMLYHYDISCYNLKNQEKLYLNLIFLTAIQVNVILLVVKKSQYLIFIFFVLLHFVSLFAQQFFFILRSPILATTVFTFFMLSHYLFIFRFILGLVVLHFPASDFSIFLLLNFRFF